MEIKSPLEVLDDSVLKYGQETFTQFAKEATIGLIENTVVKAMEEYAQQFQIPTDILTTEIMVLRERNLQIMVEHLRSEWKPKTKPSEFEIYHESQKGEVKSIIKYWDEYKCTWTDKEAAFRGYVFKKITEILNK